MKHSVAPGVIAQWRQRRPRFPRFAFAQDQQVIERNAVRKHVAAQADLLRARLPCNGEKAKPAGD